MLWYIAIIVLRDFRMEALKNIVRFLCVHAAFPSILGKAWRVVPNLFGLTH